MGIKGTKLELIRLITETENKALLEQVMQLLNQANHLTTASSLSQKETELLLQINEGLPEEIQSRYNDLLQKSVDETCTESEEAEFMSLLPQVEAKTAERMSHLVQLAQLWDSSVDAVMERLGITPPSVLHA